MAGFKSSEHEAREIVDAIPQTMTRNAREAIRTYFDHREARRYDRLSTMPVQFADASRKA